MAGERRTATAARLVLLLLALVAPGRAETLAGSRVALVLAIREADARPGGCLEAADADGRRRWAYALYRWLVASDGVPAWESLAGLEAFERQAERLDPAWVAAVAVHPSEWLEVNHDLVPPALIPPGTRQTRDGFAESVLLLGAYEIELLTAVQERDEALRDANAAFATAARNTLAERDRARDHLEGEHKSGRLVGAGELAAAERERLGELIADLEKRIHALQVEFSAYEAEWTAENGDLGSSAVRFNRRFAEYEAEARRNNARIMALWDQVTVLEKRRNRFRTGRDAVALERIERPPTTHPVLP